MNPPNPGDWQRSSPFALLFFAGNVVRILARAMLGALIPLIAIIPLVRDDPGALGILLLVLGAVLLLPFVVGAVQWACFKFRIAGDRLLIRKGVLKKTALDLPYERVQGINVRRSPVDRLFGLVTVTLDTSGSVQAEGKLPSIKTEVAHRLQRSVTALRPVLGGPAAGEGDSAAAGASGSAAPVEARSGVGRDSVLLRLGSADMVRIGLASRNFIFVAALVGVLTDLLQPGDSLDPILEAIEAGVDSAASAFTSLGALAQVGLAAAVIASIAGVALLLTVTAAFLRHHNFTLQHDGGRFRSRAGLLTQREVVVEAPKIQQLTVSQGLVLRWLRRYRLYALPAAAVSPDAGRVSAVEVPDVLEVPLLGDRLAEELRSLMFEREATAVPVLPGSLGLKRVSPHYIRALALRYALVLVAVFGTLLLLAGAGVFARTSTILFWWAASIPAAALAAWQRWRRQGYAYDRDGLASRSGFLGSEVKAFPLRKVQSATVRQSPLQRRKGLATLRVQLACGRITVPYIDRRVARALRDYILYRVESSRRRWH
ncbi:MAG: PH domain-containing protein [Gemmatimonadales bacterium]|nr:PH domain-containing protein [Candidatus Palauibacter irciniicola]MYC17786.1 PH domain-containing protein [Gemmatimonadales bacterium]